MKLKIVTYNVNGLRPRIAQYGSLRNLLNSFDADIICFQETKLRRQEMTADLIMAEGYESFFSCTRTSDKGRTGYSGVATFCRVKLAFSSDEVALPIRAEEGFTGLIVNPQSGKGEESCVVEGLDGFANDELFDVDREGRCVVTDHYHFLLFNIYGPRAESDDTERLQFKLKFFKLLQKRWEYLLSKGRRILVVGDLNIAPFAIDRCEAGPDFENNEFRRWFRSMLAEQGGHFVDVFRSKHPERQDAYTCWPQNTGAELFNYGSRIDHILCAGSCLHEEADNVQVHGFWTCHVDECDILIQYKRWKSGSTHSSRWKGGSGIKLEGSDHAPVYVTLSEIPIVKLHNTPSLSARYVPVVRGLQQTLVSVLAKRRVSKEMESCEVSCSLSDENIMKGNGCQLAKESFDCDVPSPTCTGSDLSHEHKIHYGKSDEMPANSSQAEAAVDISFASVNKQVDLIIKDGPKKKARKNQGSQLSLKSFFQKCPKIDNDVKESSNNAAVDHGEPTLFDSHTDEVSVLVNQTSSSKHSEWKTCASGPGEAELDDVPMEKETGSVALMEWQRIRQLMQNRIPLCKGHKEPCVARIVKKQGPNFGRRFYVCARAEGPASNPEANCNFFKWASDSKPRQKS